MKLFLIRSLTIGGIALAAFPISAWANGEGTGASAVVKASTGTHVEGTGSSSMVKASTGTHVEGTGASTVIKTSTGTHIEGTGSVSLVKTSTGEDLSEKQKQDQIAFKAQEKREAVEEVNALIVDSYKALLDKILNQLYANIAEASKGDRSVQIFTLSKVRDNLDQKLDALDEQNITPNRKKILQGVYFYLKSNLESRIQGLRK